MADLFLFIVIILLLVDRYLTQKQDIGKFDKLLEEISKQNKALIAKTSHDYVMMTAMDKTIKDEPLKDPDERDMSELTDKEYDLMIAKQNE